MRVPEAFSNRNFQVPDFAECGAFAHRDLAEPVYKLQPKKIAAIDPEKICSIADFLGVGKDVRASLSPLLAGEEGKYVVKKVEPLGDAEKRSH